MEITSLTNAKVKQWAKLKEKKHRDQEKKFLVEGEHLIQEAITADLVECILVETGKSHTFTSYPVYEVTKDILKKLSSSTSGTWVMAVCRMPNIQSQLGNRLIVLDDVQDPGNVGTIIRTALSFGYDAVLLSHRCADVYNEKVIRSTQGALFHIPIIRGNIIELIQQIKRQQIPVYVTSLHNATPLKNIARIQNVALVFGNEGNGVSEEVLQLADRHVFIEMKTFESLNVAVAAGICMYQFSN